MAYEIIEEYQTVIFLNFSIGSIICQEIIGETRGKQERRGRRPAITIFQMNAIHA